MGGHSKTIVSRTEAVSDAKTIGVKVSGVVALLIDSVLKQKESLESEYMRGGAVLYGFGPVFATCYHTFSAGTRWVKHLNMEIKWSIRDFLIHGKRVHLLDKLDGGNRTVAGC